MAAVEVLCTQVEWNPTPKTRKQLEKNLTTLVPDPGQLKEIVGRASGWSVPERKSHQQLVRRVTTIKRQIDNGVPALRTGWNTRSEVSEHGHEVVETKLAFGAWDVQDEKPTAQAVTAAPERHRKGWLNRSGASPDGHEEISTSLEFGWGS
ncbi:hypothetical protein IQ63_07475 [Streptomyces acidiscabies]|uniref:Uncharacterized protein n=1 Tax=Streptomyces acidiscabies TaxID=42234 RepID=A0A0L0KKW4_9ACTN|nr:hypothetical protein IQ63_07475 [Streptomyces acidiscabies]